MSHTPGPWATNPINAVVDAFVDGKPLPVCKMLWPTEERSEEDTQANARLIAAAPDLLEALRNCLCPAGGWTGMPRGMVATVQDCVDAGVCGCDCGGAVAKATAR